MKMSTPTIGFLYLEVSKGIKKIQRKCERKQFKSKYLLNRNVNQRN